MTLVEWLVWLTGSAALGILSEKIVQIVKKLRPGIVDELALGLSLIGAALISFIAAQLIPWAEGLPDLVAALVVWLASQLWYYLEKWLGTNGDIGY